MNRRFLFIIISIIHFCLASNVLADSIAQHHSPKWELGLEAAGGFVVQSSPYLRGENEADKKVKGNLSATFRFGFSDDGLTRNGYSYKGVYQGIGVGVNSFFSNSLLGIPVLLHVFQGAPFVCLNDRLTIGYEWKFGAALGWKYPSKDSEPTNEVVSTPVTAHLGVGLKFKYRVDERMDLSFGLEANHFSNGNTSLPNNGINTLQLVVGATWKLNSVNDGKNQNVISPAFQSRWFYDVIGYGAWRRRVVDVGEPKVPQLCPGKFGVAGIQFSPMRWFHRWVAVGPSIDAQWDESAGLEPYWVEGSEGENIKFERPPFHKQLAIGLSAHAELEAPIFSINFGLGINLLCPFGTKRFYQTLTLKTFVTDRLFLNVGYRLGSFKDPENLMLGLGVRI